jgi:putative hemolysin
MTVVLVLALGAMAVLTAGGASVRAVSRLWLRHWFEHRPGGPRGVARILERPARLLHGAATAAMLVASAAGMAAAWRIGPHPVQLAGAVAGVAVLLVVVGQVIPRAVGTRWAPQLAPVLVPVLQGVEWLVHPVEAVLGAVRRAAPGPATDGGGREGRDELQELLRDGAFEGLGTSEELAIIAGVVRFGDKTVRDVMTPRARLFAVSEGLPPRELAEQVARAGYSRVPVFRGTEDAIVGMVHVFDVLAEGGEGWPALRPVSHTAADRPANDLLFALLRARRHLAIVLDGGQVIGVVTLEDLLEELVGEIRDEHDDGTE